jgi:uncharacterized membrane protein YphA (DoxX/SURF4 family)
VRAWALAEWALVPLRVFIGATFTYAALQKLANPNFFNPASPLSIQSQIRAAAHTSPIHLVLTHLASSATLIGWIIAIGELAVGIGTLIGLWTRVAALGGLLISLSLFLTVSFHASPYFTGADIVFFFAWTTLLIAGGGSRLSIDVLVAYNAICPHMGCTAGYSSSSKVIVCPCHGSQFQVATGAVIEGPAPHGLTKLSIIEGANGNLYLQ